MQLIDWETTMVDCGQYLGDANAIHSCLRAEFKARQLHRDAALYAAAEGERRKIGDIDAIFVQAIMACAAQTALVKNVVGQSDFRAGVVAGSRQVAARVGAFTAQIHFPGRRHRRSQGLAKIRQIHPSAITILPLRRIKIRDLSLQVEPRSADGKLTLLDCESIAPDREFNYGIYRQWQKLPVREGKLLPIEVASVKRSSHVSAGIQGQVQIASFNRERSLDVVIEHPSI